MHHMTKHYIFLCFRSAFFSKSDFSPSQLQTALKWPEIKLAIGNWSKNIAKSQDYNSA